MKAREVLRLLPFGLFFLACDGPPVNNKTSASAQDLTLDQAAEPLAGYSIISLERGPQSKCVIEVRLEEEATKSLLKSIAQHLRSTKCAEDHAVYIAYYLHGMEIGAGAWATSHFRPELVIKILGLTATEVAKALNKVGDFGEVLGQWRSERTFSVVTLFRGEAQYVAESRFKDGSSMKEKLIPRGDNRFDIEDNDFGEYYVLLKSGDLEIRSRENLIETARRLAP